VDGDYSVVAIVGEFTGEATVTVQGLFKADSMLDLQLESISQDLLTLSIPPGMPAGTYLLEWSPSLAVDSWQVLEIYETEETADATSVTLEFPGEGFLRLRYVANP
jgi:hypothetical protein